MPYLIKRLSVSLVLLPLAFGAAQAQLRGHGGPVRALAISPDGIHAVSGSFDTSAIRWSLARNAAEQVLRFHDGAVNAVAYAEGRSHRHRRRRRATSRSGLPGHQQPDRVLDGHTGADRGARGLAGRRDARLRIVGSALSGSGRWHGGAPRVLEGNAQNVNGVAFTPDGQSCGQRGLRCDAAHLAAQGGGAD